MLRLNAKNINMILFLHEMKMHLIKILNSNPIPICYKYISVKKSAFLVYLDLHPPLHHTPRLSPDSF